MNLLRSFTSLLAFGSALIPVDGSKERLLRQRDLKADKTTICHYAAGVGEWKLITIADKALAKHFERHDDAKPGETTSKSGTPLDANCVALSSTSTTDPTESPTKKPTESPTKNPTESPTNNPTEWPTKNPTESPTKNPTESPTTNPTELGCSLNDPGTFCCVDEDCGDSLTCEFGNCLAADCDTNVDECCGNGDCGVGEACVQRECVNEGDPRFSLKWTGDDDLDLHVLTPGGAHIYFGDTTDDVSGGMLDTDDIPPEGSTDRWVENISFSTNGTAPSGEYTFWVHCYALCSPAVLWAVEVYTNGVLQDSYGGIGDSHAGCGVFSDCLTGYTFTK